MADPSPTKVTKMFSSGAGSRRCGVALLSAPTIKSCLLIHSGCMRPRLCLFTCWIHSLSLSLSVSLAHRFPLTWSLVYYYIVYTTTSPIFNCCWWTRYSAAFSPNVYMSIPANRFYKTANIKDADVLYHHTATARAKRDYIPC